MASWRFVCGGLTAVSVLAATIHQLPRSCGLSKRKGARAEGRRAEKDALLDAARRFRLSEG